MNLTHIFPKTTRKEKQLETKTTKKIVTMF
jgi:hypothetical protein